MYMPRLDTDEIIIIIIIIINSEVYVAVVKYQIINIVVWLTRVRKIITQVNSAASTRLRLQWWWSTVNVILQSFFVRNE
jgi:hypothetical protein